MSSHEFGFTPYSFEEQFLNVSNLEIGGEVLPTLDVSPEIYQGKRTILFVPGWNVKLSNYKNAFKSLVDAGRRVVSLETIGTEEEKASEMIQLLDSKNLIEVDIIAHSIGAMSAVLAGLRDNRIKHLVLLNPPGDEKDSKGLIRKYKAMLSFEEAKNFADVGTKKIHEMAKVITSFDMDKMKQSLNNIGTRVLSIHGLQDKLFPPPETAHKIDEVNEFTGNDEFVVEGNHLQIDLFIPHVLRLLET